MTAAETLATMQLLFSAATAAYLARPALAGFLIGRMVNLSLGHGTAPETPMAYVCCAVWLRRLAGNQVTAQAFGQVGLELGARLEDPRSPPAARSRPTGPCSASGSRRCGRPCRCW